MKIGLLGYGKMGKEIEKVAIERGHSIDQIIDENNRAEVGPDHIQTCDAWIDFSVPSGIIENIKFVLDARRPLVVGTTGWHDKVNEMNDYCESKNGSLIYGSNFSVGVNIFFALNKYLGGIMDQYTDYKPSVHEIHHTQKLDAPSGTAITLGRDIVTQLSRLEYWVDHESVNESSLGITSDRIENVPGTHVIQYNSGIDSIELKHTAHNRTGFALGSVLAAEWIVGKPGFFEVKQMFDF